MTRIPHWLMEQPDVKRALDEATEVIDEWTLDGTREEGEQQKAEMLVGWQGWSLLEAITGAILRARGFDTDEFEELSEHDVIDGYELPVTQLLDRSGMDISPCRGCGLPVVCIPDGLSSMCELCAAQDHEARDAT